MPIDRSPIAGARRLARLPQGAALVDRAPATVALRAGATVVVVAGGHVLDVIPPSRSRDREARRNVTMRRARPRSSAISAGSGGLDVAPTAAGSARRRLSRLRGRVAERRDLGAQSANDQLVIAGNRSVAASSSAPAGSPGTSPRPGAIDASGAGS